jgi:hypothetical protein
MIGVIMGNEYCVKRLLPGEKSVDLWYGYRIAFIQIDTGIEYDSCIGGGDLND